MIDCTSLQCDAFVLFHIVPRRFSCGIAGTFARLLYQLCFWSFDFCDIYIVVYVTVQIHIRNVEYFVCSERTAIILPPDEKLGADADGYSYTTFPEIRHELFSLPNEDGLKNDISIPDQGKNSQKRKWSDTFLIGKRTKQELKVSTKVLGVCALLGKASGIFWFDPGLWNRRKCS